MCRLLIKITPLTWSHLINWIVDFLCIFKHICYKPATRGHMAPSRSGQCRFPKEKTDPPGRGLLRATCAPRRRVPPPGATLAAMEEGLGALPVGSGQPRTWCHCPPSRVGDDNPARGAPAAATVAQNHASPEAPETPLFFLSGASTTWV